MVNCVSILESKSSDFYFDNKFDLEEGQNIKISSKYQNPDDHQNIKITALSTPNFARKAQFFSIFKDLQENIRKSYRKLAKHSDFAENPSHQISKYQNIWSYFDILAVLSILILYLVFWIFLLEISKICTQGLVIL